MTYETIGFLELNSIELLPTIAMPITAAPETTGTFISERLSRNTSSIVATVDARDTSIKVRSPAACLLLERSQPITADRRTERLSLSIIECTLSDEDHSPRSCAIGSK